MSWGVGSVGKIFATILLLLATPFLFGACMHHDHILNKTNFDLLTPSVRLGGGVCGQNICYHVVEFWIQFNLICNMTIF